MTVHRLTYGIPELKNETPHRKVTQVSDPKELHERVAQAMSLPVDGPRADFCLEKGTCRVTRQRSDGEYLLEYTGQGGVRVECYVSERGVSIGATGPRPEDWSGEGVIGSSNHIESPVSPEALIAQIEASRKKMLY